MSDINAGSEHVDGADQQRSDQEKGQTRNMITSNVVEPEAKKHAKTFPVLPGELERGLVQVFKLLSDETRLRVLLYLAQEGELHVTALCDKLGQSQPAVSHHLALLRVAGLIEARRDGKHNFYSVRKIHFHRIIGELFSNISDPDNEVRFEDYVLTQN